MRATTVRFAPELWDTLDAEASLAGISVAQFLREAAIMRIAYSAGRRSDGEYGAAYKQGTGEPARKATREAARDLRESSKALRSEGRQAARHSDAIKSA